MQVEVSDQVFDFVLSQAPDSRKKLRQALRNLERELGAIRSLEGRLSGYHRLRVGSFRIVFRYILVDQKRVIRCEFIERRSIVYEMMEKIIHGLH